MRVFFPKSKQREFIYQILTRLSVKEAAKTCNLSDRTIRDWRREKFSMEQEAVQKLCKKTGIVFPANIELRKRYWYVANGSSKGGVAVYKKYGCIGGDPEYRKKKWREWWEREGKHRKHPIINVVKPIRKPGYSDELAEFVGIMLGDGGITQRQITITLHHKDDKDYSLFVVNLIKRLFNVPVASYYYAKDSKIDYVVSRSELVNFCTEKLGLKQGSKVKQQVDIPDWIKQNRSHSLACTRGLVDTDGCIFTHHYKVKGKLYSYKKLCFTSYSKPLRQSVFRILKDIGLNPRLAAHRDVRIDSQENMKKYFEIINSHNPKHLARYTR